MGVDSIEDLRAYDQFRLDRLVQLQLEGRLISCDRCHIVLDPEAALEALVWGGLCYTCWSAVNRTHREPGSRGVVAVGRGNWPVTVDEVELE